MDDKTKTEVFNSTEINIESDTSDDWELMSKFEVDTYSVPYLSVPKMHEIAEESDSISYRKGKEIDMQSVEGIFIQHARERERKEDKQEHLPPHEQYRENEGIGRELDETMLGLSQNDQENDRVRREMEEAMQDLHLNDQENDRVRREMEEAMQDLHQNDQGNDRIKRELDEVLQEVPQNEQENDRVRREMYEAMQELHQNDQDSDRIRREIGEAMRGNVFQDPYPVPYLSFPKMHEFVEESNLISYGQSTGNDRQSDQDLFSQLDREEERINEGKQEQFHRQEEYEESEKLQREIDEAVQNKSLQYEQEQGNEKVKRAIEETLHDVPENKRENESDQREMEEAINEIHAQHKQERRSRSLTCLDQHSDSKVKMEFPTIKHELKLLTETSATLQEEQPDRMLCEKENTATQENTNVPSAARCFMQSTDSESQIHAVECESLAIAGSRKRVVHSEFFETIHKILEFNFALPDKVSTEAAEVNKSEEEKNLSVQINSKGMESFKNEKLDNPSSDKENKMEKLSKEEND